MTTLILFAHPDPARSRANEALLAAAGGATVNRLATRYPDGAIDPAAEAAQVLEHDALVLQFPLQWYAMPALLKDWLDAVLTRMVYVHGDTEGARLRGRKLLVAVTCGAPESAYRPDGRNGFTLDELLRPLQATALRCGLAWQAPFVVYDARDAAPDVLAQAGARYAAALAALAA
ncbi:putative NADPH-quinone reductase [Pseudoduganella flava]|uniref:Flavodoxin family protein n=1 Tax=Pseudoduganella flava TaxID=871742 RepID=A0A562PEJ3_9BURK|nr:NAD(P)H-dependent oxidoreductase [Pseudoduganella flava]QGZ38776.1 flavodoxin family protein [Pseudoduganella flava]TWI42828.1 putative NADPH-quinone reductase [Pseudoduganella flava]